MFQGIKNGWDIIKESIKVFFHHPKFLVPLLITWIIYAPIVLYFKYAFDWEAYSSFQIMWIIFGIIFVFAFLLSFSCSILLELIEQLETGQKTSLTKSFFYTLYHNTLKIIPLAFVWAIIWFILTVLQAIFSKRKGKGEQGGDDESFSAEGAARTLSGQSGGFSLSKAFFKALEKGVRMIMFLILPAIAWENFGFFKSFRRGLSIFKSRVSEFITGFVLTEAAAMIIFLPPAIIFYLSEEGKISLPEFIWVIVIIYIAFAWSYTIYLEQMFAAELYLWHLKWEKQAERAKIENRPIPTMRDIQKPSVLDEVHELLEKQ